MPKDELAFTLKLLIIINLSSIGLWFRAGVERKMNLHGSSQTLCLLLQVKIHSGVGFARH